MLRQSNGASVVSVAVSQMKTTQRHDGMEQDGETWTGSEQEERRAGENGGRRRKTLIG